MEFEGHLEKTLKERIEKATSDVAERRRLCYEEASNFFHEKNWYPQNQRTKEPKYTALPSCIVWTIRRKCEAPNGKYTGFPPKSKLLQKAFEAREAFDDGMKVHKSVVDVANPDGGLFTALQRPEAQEQLKAVILSEVSTTRTTAEQMDRWTQSIDNCVNVLPRLGFVYAQRLSKPLFTAQ